MLKTNAILRLIKEQCSTNRCQCREAGLKCTGFYSCNDSDDDDHESSVVDNVDDDHDDDDDEEEEEEEECICLN